MAKKPVSADPARLMSDSRDAAEAEASTPDADPLAPTPDKRAHMWERVTPAHDLPDAPKQQAAGGHELPRWMHKDGEQKFVRTQEEFDAADADGWEVHPGLKSGKKGRE